MGRILGNRCIVRLHHPIDMDDRSGILGAGIDGIRWQSAGVEMSTYQWHCSHPDRSDTSWHLAYPDGRVYRTIRKDEDGLWCDDRYGTRYISLATAKDAVVHDYEDMYSTNKEEDAWRQMLHSYALQLDAWNQLPWYKRIFTDKPDRPQGL